MSLNSETQLLRQIHPKWYQEGKISSIAFNPSEDHDFKLSCYNGDKFLPKDAYDHFIQNNKSIGVVAVRVSDVENLDIKAYEDNISFDGHCVIDFEGVDSTNARKKKASQLRKKAEQGGFLFENNL